ncbi:hypothetical protein [Opitutus sp. ER46]|nr:hypothetical protein [Opitutus sp. ER46]
MTKGFTPGAFAANGKLQAGLLTDNHLQPKSRRVASAWLLLSSGAA